jgi:hypothetical protein
MTMHIGKHKGKTFSEIAEIDKPYAAWVLRDSALPGSFRKFAKYLQANHGGILEVGKHKMKFFDVIVQTDPDYCEWALRLKQPSETFKKFVEYLQDAFDDEQPEKKKSKTELSYVCNICCATDVKTVFVPCGHIVCCIACGFKFEGGSCPICKKYVCMTVETFVA